MIKDSFKNTDGLCDCPNRYSFAPHSDGHALMFASCMHRHGYNLANISDPDIPMMQSMIYRLNRIPDHAATVKRLEKVVNGIRALIKWPTDDPNPPYRSLPPSEILKRIEAALNNEKEASIERLEEEIVELQTHASTSDFCSSEWKNDADELRSLLKRGKEIIEQLVPGSREEQREYGSFIDDAQAALAGGKEAKHDTNS